MRINTVIGIKISVIYVAYKNIIDIKTFPLANHDLCQAPR